VRVVQPVQANEIFVSFPPVVAAALLEKGAHFYDWIEVPGIDLPVWRLVTAFSTTAAEVDAFVDLAGSLASSDTAR
jgi:threonine aldolase